MLSYIYYSRKRMNEIYSRYATACGILHTTLVDVVGALAIQHGQSKSQDPNEALAEVLKGTPNITKSIHSLLYECNMKKIFITGTSTVKNKIDIANLDITILTDICICIDGFVTNRNLKTLRNDKCNEAGHGTVTRCCINCSHDCIKCKKNPCGKKCCNTKQKSGNCNHECSACKEGYVECNNNLKVCCLKCKICIHCAKSLQKQTRCIILILRQSIKKIKSLRNTLAHSTNEDFENFATKQITFPGFSNCKTWEDLWDVFNEILEDCLTFLRSHNYITANERTDKLLEMQHILNCPLSEVEVEYGEFIETINKFIQEQKPADTSTLANKDDIGKIREDFKILAEKIEAHTKANIVPQIG